ncbi:hypothetical protein [Flavobacterium hercynium]|uniref:Uncharacterized protein n=1 Tax=Flavobacterium hercynium TaxID=387094 RepID=A0A226HME4_9FLAO|nr:hypothetical protein [Flavobacterium hercynium]OXA94796.1 hypothetical protein B0A66_03440 [Flavobacterium hercynium]SMP07989.1 hypothetical protein SAMN06265346_102119 [Flavobacterium hercynium]
MKIKNLFLFLVLTIVSCQKDQKKTQTKNTLIAENTQIAEVEKKGTEERILHIDTIKISENKNDVVSHVFANLMKQEADKNSIVTSTFRLDFFKGKTKISSSTVAIQYYEKNSEWGGSLGLSNSSTKNSSFIKIETGYPACGYTFSNYLFYLKNNNLQLVHEWEAMSDGGWGIWTEFITDDLDKDPVKFYCKTVSLEPDDNDTEDSGVLKYSDSTLFSLQGNKWKKKLLSAKEKPYFEKKTTATAFYQQD